MAEETDLTLDEFAPDESAAALATTTTEEKSAGDLATVFDVPVNISAVLGRANLSVAQLLQLGQGSVLELDRKVVSTSTTAWWRAARWWWSTSDWA